MNMTQRSLSRLVAMAGLILLWCGMAAAQDVRYNFAAGTDFSKYKTYTWVDVPGAKYPNQILDGQIKQAIDSQLALRGLTRATDPAAADMYAAYQLSINQEQQWNSYSTGGGMGWGWRGGWGMGMESTTVTNTTIHVGTLVLDLYDVVAKTQVWTGRATKQLNPSKDPAKNQKNLQKAMAKLLKNYPPGAKK